MSEARGEKSDGAELEEEGEMRVDSRGETDRERRKKDAPAEQKDHSLTVWIDVIFRHIASRINWGGAGVGGSALPGRSWLLAWH